jgi:hypothetical protein
LGAEAKIQEKAARRQRLITGGTKMCASFLFRMQRRFLRLQLGDQSRDSLDGKLVGHRCHYFLVVLDLFVELLAYITHPKVPFSLAAGKTCC